MIDPNFQPPERSIAVYETARRKGLLPWVKSYFDDVTTGIFIGGSLSYGANYSVTPQSDIDIQLVLDDKALDSLAGLDLYDRLEIEHAISGYRQGIYRQFSLVGEKEGVSIESHFWSKEAFIKAIDYTNSETSRLRSSISTPSTDYRFAFDGSSDAVDFYGEIVEGFPVSPFPSYRVVDSKLYLCRPITTIVGGPLILKTDSEYNKAINDCWTGTVHRLIEARRASEEPAKLSLANALPSQYKMSPEAKEALITKTESLISSLNTPAIPSQNN